MADTDIWLMGLAAIFAACKSEDNPRALQDIIYHGLRPERVGETLKPHRPKLFERTKADEKVPPHGSSQSTLSTAACHDNRTHAAHAAGLTVATCAVDLLRVLNTKV